jgi:AMP nucleosidase
LYQDYGAHISVGLSQHEIPYPYVIDGSALTLDRSMSAGLTRYFPTTELSQIGDETADGCSIPPNTTRFPISMPAASISRWRACATIPARRSIISSRTCCLPTTPATSMSSCWGCSQILDPDSPYIALSCAGGIWITADTEAPEQAISDLAWKSIRCPPGT